MSHIPAIALAILGSAVVGATTPEAVFTPPPPPPVTDCTGCTVELVSWTPPSGYNQSFSITWEIVPAADDDFAEVEAYVTGSYLSLGSPSLSSSGVDLSGGAVQVTAYYQLGSGPCSFSCGTAGVRITNGESPAPKNAVFVPAP